MRKKGGIDRRDSFHICAYSSLVGAHVCLASLSEFAIFGCAITFANCRKGEFPYDLKIIDIERELIY